MSSVEREPKILSRREIEALITQGHHVFILDGVVIKADGWLKYHPGGPKAIEHMVGRDATDEVKALHSPDAQRRMQPYRIGRIDGRWENFLPPIQGGKFRHQEEKELPETSIEVSDFEQNTSSRNGSEAASPIFDAPEYDSSLRWRRVQGQGASSDATSISSIDLDEDGPKMSHLDMRTREELRLDESKYPPLDPDVQDQIVRKYRLLNEKIKAENLYQCRYWCYGIDALRCALLFLTSQYILRRAWEYTGWHATGLYALSAVFLGLMWYQLVFSAHDAGHMGITHDFQIDTAIGIVISDFIGGLSMGWWKMSHNVHHIVTNSPEHDPDIQHLPFFAVSHRFLESLTSTYYEKVLTHDFVSKFTLQFQHYLYYPILLFGRFNLYRLSWIYLLAGQGPKKGPAWWHRWFELIGHAFFWTWFGYGLLYKSLPTATDRIIFLLVSHMATAQVHVQITLSHFAMSTSDLGVHESFPQKMLRTTMDVDCPEWLDFIHGGLQFQVIHHLYPRIPRHNLRQAQKLVQEFCEDVNIPYALYGFVDGNKQVIGRLEEVARQAAIFAACQKTIAASTDFGLGH
ncbi:fatty acid desaturase [Tothia fuscella]|uniref:Delta 8-(E)-sphingolipid desaturase n=1 Tax=Tothia fuscella TaxID=1048955 RepID=A0A9P4NHT0_9PEZI|nr:fatty acid desaturase [Tothia fuscella]